MQHTHGSLQFLRLPTFSRLSHFLKYLCLSLCLSAGTALAAADVNTADQAALDSIAGVGPTTSKAILDERARHGNYKDWADLERRVKGIGERNAVKLSAAGLLVNGQSRPAGLTTMKMKADKADKTDKLDKPEPVGKPEKPVGLASSANAANTAKAGTTANTANTANLANAGGAGNAGNSGNTVNAANASKAAKGGDGAK